MSELFLILKFFMMFLGVYFEERLKAKERKEKFELSETEILNLTSASLQKMREAALRESILAGKAEEQLEKEISGEPSEHTDDSTTRIELESDESGRLRKVVPAPQSDASRSPQGTKQNKPQS